MLSCCAFLVCRYVRSSGRASNKDATSQESVSAAKPPPSSPAKPKKLPPLEGARKPNPSQMPRKPNESGQKREKLPPIGRAPPPALAEPANGKSSKNSKKVALGKSKSMPAAHNGHQADEDVREVMRMSAPPPKEAFAEEKPAEKEKKGKRRPIPGPVAREPLPNVPSETRGPAPPPPLPNALDGDALAPPEPSAEPTLPRRAQSMPAHRASPGKTATLRRLAPEESDDDGSESISQWLARRSFTPEPVDGDDPSVPVGSLRGSPLRRPVSRIDEGKAMSGSRVGLLTSADSSQQIIFKR